MSVAQPLPRKMVGYDHERGIYILPEPMIDNLGAWEAVWDRPKPEAAPDAPAPLRPEHPSETDGPAPTFSHKPHCPEAIRAAQALDHRRRLAAVEADHARRSRAARILAALRDLLRPGQ